MEPNNKCIFCENSLNESSIIKYHTGIIDVSCPNCGNYKITSEAYDDLPTLLNNKYKNERHLICGLIFERHELKISNELITNENFESIYHSLPIPKTLSEKSDKILLYIYRRTRYFREMINYDLAERKSIAYALHDKEFQNLISFLRDERKYITYTPIYFSLTYEGWERAEQISRQIINSKQCFVAMWFSNEMLKTFNNNIKPAIEKTGYEPLIIVAKEYNDDINDAIIAEIRKSKFVVADLTGNRGGVYYEAGFAFGLGLDVIFTCREDWFNKEVEVIKKAFYKDKEVDVSIKEKRNIHFDINHKNIINWKDGDDLYKKLKDRIEATII